MRGGPKARRRMTETILWRRLDCAGHEIATLDELDHGWKLSGAALFSCEQGPTKLDYAVICDSVWRTDSADRAGTWRYRATREAETRGNPRCRAFGRSTCTTIEPTRETQGQLGATVLNSDQRPVGGWSG